MKKLKININNKIQCNKCEEIIESKYTHDFKWCKCRNCAVDGGLSYVKRCGDNWTDVSECREASRQEKEKYIKNNVEDFLIKLSDSEIDNIVDKIMEEY